MNDDRIAALGAFLVCLVVAAIILQLKVWA